MKGKYFVLQMVAALIIAGTAVSAPKSGERKSGSCGAEPDARIEEKAQTLCPVMGGAVDKQIFVDHDGKRVYFCCASCIDAFRETPEPYLEKLHRDGVRLEDAPKDADKKTT